MKVKKREFKLAPADDNKQDFLKLKKKNDVEIVESLMDKDPIRNPIQMKRDANTSGLS